MSGIDNTSSGRDRINDGSFTCYAERQFKRLSRRVFPVHEVPTAGIGQVVTGRGIRCIPPEPEEVIHPIGPKAWTSLIGVHLISSGYQLRIEKSAPCPGPHIVDVINLTPGTALPVAVMENKLPIGGPLKFWISTTSLACSNHRLHLLECRNIMRFRRTEIKQRMYMHISGQVDISLLVHRKRNIVV